MMTAAEARSLSQESLAALIADELESYMKDCVAPAIEKAANLGLFQTIVGFNRVNHYKSVAEAAIKLLKQAGFAVKHVYNCEQRDYENHLEICWGDKV